MIAAPPHPIAADPRCFGAPPGAVSAPGGDPFLDTWEQIDKAPETFDNLSPIDLLSSLRSSGDQAAARRLIVAALRDRRIDATPEQRRVRDRRAFSLEQCCSTFGAYASAGGRGKVAPHHCDQAVCPRCAYHRTRKIREKYDHAVALAKDEGRRVRLITLTQVARGGEDWTTARGRLLKAWRYFWRDKDTRAHITGGMRRVETTWSSAVGGWHVHIHLAYDGKFWNQADVRETWERYASTVETMKTRRHLDRSVFVDLVLEDRIQLPPGLAPVDLGDRVTVPAGTVWRPFLQVRIQKADRPGELFKYLLKTAKAPAARLVEYTEQATRARLMELIGSWRSLELPPPKEETDPFFEVDPDMVRDLASGAISEDDAPWRLIRHPQALDTPQRDKLGKPLKRPDGTIITRRRTPPELVKWARSVAAGLDAAMDKLAVAEWTRLDKEITRRAARLPKRWKVKAPAPPSRAPDPCAFVARRPVAG